MRPLLSPAIPAQAGPASPPGGAAAPAGPDFGHPGPATPPLGVWFALLLIFVLYCRLPEYLFILFGTSGFVVRILIALALIATVFAHGLHRAFVSRFGVLLTAFTLLVCLSTPFGVWPGGSMNTLTSWLKSFVFFIAPAGLLVTAVHTRRALYAIGWASILLGLLSTVFSISDSGRLAGWGATIGNANYLALFLLFGIPPCILMARAGRGWLLRLTGVAGAIWLSALIIRTASRGGLISLLLVFLLLFLSVRTIAKLKLALATVLVLAIVAAQSPETIMSRYRTLFSSGSDGDEPEISGALSEDASDVSISAVESTARRKILVREAIKLTLLHPILGVGPGMFKVAANPVGSNLYGWQETHNTYVQISSELGVPAFLIFLAILWHGLKTNFLFSRRLAAHNAREDLAPIAQCLFLSFVTAAAGALFASLAYDFFIAVLAGIAVGFEPVARTALAGIPPPRLAYPSYSPVAFRPPAQRSGL